MKRLDAVLKDILAGSDLAHYAAHAALKELVTNWSAVIADSNGGADGGGNLPDIIDQDLSDTVTVLQNSKAALVAACYTPATADSGLKPRELANLLNRAAAAIETSADLSESDRDALVGDLTLAAASAAVVLGGGECPECGADIAPNEMRLPCSECGALPPPGNG